MSIIHSRISHVSGIPLGGIGTGTVEIRPDGLFHEWEVCNNGPWSPESSCCGESQPMRPEDLVFRVRTRTADGRVTVRYLALNSEMVDLCSLPGLRCVQAIEFDGTFPVARLAYIDQTLPVRITAELFSPFVPLDSRSSGTPGFSIRFGLENKTSQPLEVSIYGSIRNIAGCGQESREPHNTLQEISCGRAILLSADGMRADCGSSGNMAFAAAGGEVSYAVGCWELDHRAMNYAENRFGRRVFSLLHQFETAGCLPNLNAERAPRFPAGFSAGDLDSAERETLLSSMLQHPAFLDEYQRLALFAPDYVSSPLFLDDLADHIREIAGWPWKMEWGSAGLCSKSEVPPEGESEALFAVGWYFPNHISPTGENIGHAYARWFDNSLDVVSFLVDNYRELRAKTFALPEAIHKSSLPAEAADAITSQLSTLVKCTWWTNAEHFGVWEGLGCCGFNTTDIAYQGSFPIISLFPDLQKAAMEHSAAFQRQDGRVCHYFTPDLGSVDHEFDRVDMNQQFVMLAARDYLWTGDRDYLHHLWPHIVRAMDNTALLDTDGDGLPDAQTSRNTYDYWDFQGCPSYIASLWLGALKAAARLAGEIGDADRAAGWLAAYDKGLASFEERLWNGDYYVLWRDGDELDECCMSDQMSGDWFSSACGWGTILDPDRIRTALASIIRWNFRDDRGLFNASYPPGKKHRPGASGNSQADACWTGVEYTVASLLISQGEIESGLALVRDIHDRYFRAGRVWNQTECGNHYYRALSSWTLLLSLSGFAWDHPAGRLTFAPVAQETCEFPFFTPVAWGVFRQETGSAGQRAAIRLVTGEVELRELRVPNLQGGSGLAVTLGGCPIPCDISESGAHLQFGFHSPVILNADGALLIGGVDISPNTG